MKRRIRVLNPNSAWRGGHHVLAAIDLVREIYRAGGDIHLHLIRSLVDMTDVPHKATVPWILKSRGMPWIEERRRSTTELKYLSTLKPSDIAWLWPTTSLETFREAAKLGCPIVMEGINTRIAYSRRLLFDIYDREGLKRDTMDKMVAEEEEMLSLASYFFSPSPAVSEALVETGSSFGGEIFETSYGASMPAAPINRKRTDGKVIVLFIGKDSLRKNLHGLLRAWRILDPKNAELRILGEIAPQVVELCKSELEMESVKTLGFVQNLDEVYRNGDIFVIPSIEEGSPRVTYQAAGYGLPIVASKMGAGRLATREGVIAEVDPFDISSIADVLGKFINDPDLREEYGNRGLAIAQDYDWPAVGQDRFHQLCKAFGEDDLRRAKP